MAHKNWHQKHIDNMSRGERFAIGFVRVMGTLKFVTWFNIFVAVWITLNVWLGVQVLHLGGFELIAWDAYPFILLNLFFSWQASNAASFILIAQNDQAKRDKIQAEHQYEHQEKELQVNTKLTKEIHTLVTEMHKLSQGGTS